VIGGGQIAVWNVDPYATLDPIIRLFDLGDLRHTGRLVGHRDAVTVVRRLSDTRLLSRSEDEGMLCLWNTSTATLEQKATVREAIAQRPDWLALTARIPLVSEEHEALGRWEIGRAVGIASRDPNQPLTLVWNGREDLRSFRILPSGRLIALSDSGPIVLQCRRGLTDLSWEDCRTAM
jgi:hypothetical protein